jgi:hypothetical protein
MLMLSDTFRISHPSMNKLDETISLSEYVIHTTMSHIWYSGEKMVSIW